MTDTPQITLTPSTYSLTCPACREHLLSAEVSPCDTCAIPHHAECLTEIGCSSLNCNPGGTRTHRALGDLQDNPLAVFVTEGRLHASRYEEAEEDSPAIVHAGHCHEGGDYDGTDTSAMANWGFLEHEFGGACCTVSNLPGGCNCPAGTGADNRQCEFYSVCTFEILPTPCQCSPDNEPWECEQRAVEHLTALEEYAALSEDDDWQYREALLEQEWQDYMRGEFLSALITAYQEKCGLSSADVGLDIPDASLDRLRWTAMERTETYPEFSDYDGTWPLQEWAEDLLSHEDTYLPLVPYFEVSTGDNHGPWQITSPQDYAFRALSTTAEVAEIAYRQGLEEELTPLAVYAQIRLGMSKRGKSRDSKWERIQLIRALLSVYSEGVQVGQIRAAYPQPLYGLPVLSQEDRNTVEDLRSAAFRRVGTLTHNPSN